MAGTTTVIKDKTILSLIGLGIVAAVVNAAFTLILFMHGQQLYNQNQAAAKQQGAKIVHSVCLTFDRLAALKPPPGNPTTNPSREYDQELHNTLAQLGPDLECGNG